MALVPLHMGHLRYAIFNSSRYTIYSLHPTAHSQYFRGHVSLQELRPRESHSHYSYQLNKAQLQTRITMNF